MARQGLRVGTKTLFGLTEHLYNLLYPLSELIRGDVLDGRWVHIDESPMPFYNPSKSRGYVWTLSNNRGAYYQFEPNRRGEVAQEMLSGYHEGVVVTMEGHYLASTTLGKAIIYYNERREGLHHFLTDKNVPICNNMAERRQRCPVMGRKNFSTSSPSMERTLGRFFTR